MVRGSALRWMLLLSCAAAFGVIALAVQCSTTYQPPPLHVLRAACETLPPSSRTQVVHTPTILIMEGDPLNPASGTSIPVPPPAEDFCVVCVDALRRGFTSVEDSPSSDLQWVRRSSLVDEPNDACLPPYEPEPGKCLLVQPHVRRTARYAVAFQNDMRDGPEARLSTHTVAVVDLTRRRVIGSASNHYLVGDPHARTPTCDDVGYPHGDPDTFIRQTILPTQR